jgi:ABC-type transport system involved in multi-copper enzyme maturation permease subunit
MIFGLGPVVRYELITTARRGRFYIARAIYGLCLLFLLSEEFRDFDRTHPGGGTAEQLQTFAESAFIQFAWAQGAALLCLIPALVSGVIADEHQRKTLHYLLASRLSSAEIVLGKLGARTVHVATFVALGIPVVCLLALYGGLNPENVCYVYVGTLTTVIFISGFSILLSIMARRPRDAIVAAYGIGTVWLLVPLWLQRTAIYLDGGPLWWVRPLNEWVLMTNPRFVWRYSPNLTFRLGGLRGVWFATQFSKVFYWMIALQSLLGVLFITLAVLGLRPMRGSSWPAAQPQVGRWWRLATRLRAITRSRVATPLTENQLLSTLATRPPCGDDPMLWKERHTSIGGGLRWLGSRPVVLFFSVLLGCFLLDVAAPVIVDTWSAGQRGNFRSDVSDALRGTSMVLAVLGMLGVAASAAVSLTGEREQDTWISLATTLLTPAEVIRAKQFGAVWSVRRIGLALLTVWVVGTLLAAIHPLGTVAAAGYVVLIAWFIATIGVLASSLAKNSTRALVMTFTVILIYTAISQWPGTVWKLLFPYQDLPGRWAQSSMAPSKLSAAISIVIGVAPPAAVQLVGAALLSLGSRRRLRSTWGR